MSLFRLEPVDFETVPQVQTCPMKHYPQIVYANAQNLANLFALQAVHFTQSKRAGRPLRQRRETIAEDLPEVAALNQLRRRGVPLARGAVGVPMPYPLVASFKEIGMFGTFVESFTDGSFALSLPKMIDDLVFEYSHQPSPFRTAALKLLVGFQGPKESLL